jgi:hypothetical protein
MLISGKYLSFNAGILFPVSRRNQTFPPYSSSDSGTASRSSGKLETTACVDERLVRTRPLTAITTSSRVENTSATIAELKIHPVYW